MKLDYLQFLELEVFTRFGTRLEASAEAKIQRGRLLREILKQDRLSPLPASFQLAWLIAYNEGLFDTYAQSTIALVLKKIADEFIDVTLSLDAGRNEWLARIKTCLGCVP